MPLRERASREAAGRVGAAVRHGLDQTEARRDLAEARLREAITKVVDSAPPLTAEQRDRLAALLRPAGARSAEIRGGDAA